MKKLLLVPIFLTFAIIAPMPTIAGAEDAPQGSLTGRDEKKEGPSLEKGKPAGAEKESNWKINVQPVQPPDNVKSLPERKDENKQTPPDRF